MEVNDVNVHIIQSEPYMNGSLNSKEICVGLDSTNNTTMNVFYSILPQLDYKPITKA